ncbi:hypothetical protein BCR33DRAFT_715471 [Rhizoclosmatium globosum]|uniref:F-box domain-containing protein n=1 Tax=Rhizoclosmatium globosum TaxID=329046 RepID=A0A1Y2CHP6_9FUNG|nr:hypothetical protein BCR33DRAFT_715471 [Rhizoclosmatium globosum]|eukprot:ORY46354.1 hypothetical protein BCR33DRAFT_715471 [Rhizoclosmatium globosum]
MAELDRSFRRLSFSNPVPPVPRSHQECNDEGVALMETSATGLSTTNQLNSNHHLDQPIPNCILPAHILFLIFSHIHPSSVLRFRRVSRSLNSLLMSPAFASSCLVRFVTPQSMSGLKALMLKQRKRIKAVDPLGPIPEFDSFTS